MLRRTTRGGRCRSALAATVLLLVIANAAGCGGGDRAAAPAHEGSSAGTAAVPDLGRYKVVVFRGTLTPQLFRFDSSNGEITFAPILKAKVFAPMTTETPPGLHDPIQPGRFTLDSIPGKGGAALLRTDTASGRVWILHLTAKPKWQEIETHRDSSDAAKPPEQAILPEKNLSPEQTARREAAKADIVLPQDQPSPTPQLAALQHMLDSEKTTPELRAWAVGELATHYPEESQRILAALRSANALEAIAAIEAVDVLSYPRYASVVKALRNASNPSIAAAAEKKLAADD